MLRNKNIFAFKLLEVAFIMLINVKMPTLVGILTFMSMFFHVQLSIENITPCPPDRNAQMCKEFVSLIFAIVRKNTYTHFGNFNFVINTCNT